MKFNELLSNSKAQFLLDVFSVKSISAIETSLTEENGKIQDNKELDIQLGRMNID